MVTLAQVWNVGGSELVTVSLRGDETTQAPPPIIVLEVAGHQVRLDAEGARQLAAVLGQAAAVLQVSGGVTEITQARARGTSRQ